MARTLEEYLQEQQKYTDVGRKAVLDQLSNMPQQQAADESALNAQVDRQYKAIEAGANRKGNFYSGIPVAEKQTFLATDFAPALANLKSQNVARKATLEATLADLGRQDYTNAFNMYNTDRTFAEEQRQYEEQKAAQEAATRAQNDWYAKLYGQQQAAAAPKPVEQPKAQVIQNGADFQFRDTSGKPITAAQYAAATGTDIRTVLSRMAQAGDRTAAVLYNQAINDKNFTNPANYAKYASQYAHILGGVGNTTYIGSPQPVGAKGLVPTTPQQILPGLVRAR